MQVPASSGDVWVSEALCTLNLTRPPHLSSATRAGAPTSSAL